MSAFIKETSSNAKSPFNLSDTKAYEQWREKKLDRLKTHPYTQQIILNSAPPTFLPFSTKDQQQSLNTILNEANHNGFCLYSIKDFENATENETKHFLHRMMQYSGMRNIDHNLCADDDHLTSITQQLEQQAKYYIPYSDKPLSWHTDGYYNSIDKQINTMLLHCYRPAASGGESCFLDHEMAYLLIRDRNPDWIKALSHTNVMTIPANIFQGKCIRVKQSGPVFSVSPTGKLHMRFSARGKNIIWRNDKHVHDALSFLNTLLKSDSEFIVSKKLNAGEGIISKNILHNRTGFTDSENSKSNRILIRGRYYDELARTVTHVLG